MTEQTGPQQGPLVALLEFAAELERLPSRPDDSELNLLARRLSLDTRTARWAARLRYGPQTRSVAGAAAVRCLKAVGVLLWSPARALQAAYAKRPYVTTFMLTASVWLAMFGFLAVAAFSETASFAGLAAIAIFYVCALAAVSYARASARAAVGSSFFLSGLWIAVVLVPYVVLTALGLGRQFPPDTLFYILTLFAVLTLGFLPVLTFSAAAGGYVGALRKLKSERDADRQSLLRRVFDLSAKLGDAEQASVDGATAEVALAAGNDRGWLERLLGFAGPVASLARRNVIASTFVFFLAGVVLRGALVTFAFHTWPPPPGADAVVPNAISALLGVLVFFGLFQLGTMAASLRKGMWMLPAVFVASVAGEALAHQMAPAAVRPTAIGGLAVPFALILGSLTLLPVYAIPVLAGAMAGAYRAFLERERLLRENDRQTLTTEIERLRGELRKDTRQATFVCVDVVGSTGMKQGADPLAVEYSFTEYQRYVAAKVYEHGGTIHSTAGDGAVAVFEGVLPALETALAIQAGLGEFNGAVNTLDAPFHLRIGIHSGHVPGAGTTVAFSEVLDVAAHVEKACPPGQVAMTRDAAEFLDDSFTLEELPEIVDGRSVVIVCATGLAGREAPPAS